MYVEYTRLTNVTVDNGFNEILVHKSRLQTSLTLEELQEIGLKFIGAKLIELLPNGYRLIFDDMLMGDTTLSACDVVTLKK